MIAIDYEKYNLNKLFSVFENTQKNKTKLETEIKKKYRDLEECISKSNLIQEAITKKLKSTSSQNSKILQIIRNENFTIDELNEINAELDQDIQDGVND